MYVLKQYLSRRLYLPTQTLVYMRLLLLASKACLHMRLVGICSLPGDSLRMNFAIIHAVQNVEAQAGAQLGAEGLPGVRLNGAQLPAQALHEVVSIAS